MSKSVVKAVADGPTVFVPGLGCSVPTFTTKHEGRFKPLAYHVPPVMRGQYRPHELANYEETQQYRTDDLGYALCSGKTQAEVDCLLKATNRSGYCDKHGGELHSDDKFIKTDQSNIGETQALSRYKQYLAGIITVDDLDDEELASCGFRARNGRLYKPKSVPRDLAQAFTKAIYERAQVQLRALTVDAVSTVGEIMKNKTNEPDIRLKAALSVIERNMGKPTQVVSITADKPFEEVFADVFTGTREESRRRRAEYIDAEEVPLDDERSNSVETDNGQPQEYTSMPGPIEQSSSIDDSKLLANVGEPIPQGDPSMFRRNEAILAQTVEIKPFNYDLSDKSAEIKKATQKRNAARVLGIDLNKPNIPYIREENQLDDGTWLIKYIDPTVESKDKSDRRKTYTMSDF